MRFHLWSFVGVQTILLYFVTIPEAFERHCPYYGLRRIYAVLQDTFISVLSILYRYTNHTQCHELVMNFQLCFMSLTTVQRLCYRVLLPDWLYRGRPDTLLQLLPLAFETAFIYSRVKNIYCSVYCEVSNAPQLCSVLQLQSLQLQVVTSFKNIPIFKFIFKLKKQRNEICAYFKSL